MAINFFNSLAVGTNVLYVDTLNDRVGIGTNTPDTGTNLHVLSGTSSGQIKLTSQANTQFQFYGDGNQDINYGQPPNFPLPGGDAIGQIRYSHGSNYMAFTTNNAERMRINSAGNVGIGTTNPSYPLSIRRSGDGIKFEVSDNVDANCLIEVDGTDIKFGPSTSSDLILMTDFSERMRIDSSGNVGIGTTNPSNGKLQIDSASNQISIETGTSGDGRLHIGHFSNGAFIGTYGDDGGAADLIRFGTHSGDERMRIASDGKLGLGTSSPTRLFHVAGASASAIMTLQRTNGNSGGSYGALQWTASDDHTVATIDARADGDNEGAHLLFHTTSAASSNDPYGINERMRITSTGNVGIGTTAPDTKLHVEGNLLVDAYSQGENNGIFLREGFLTIDQPSITVWDMSNSGASPDGLSINAQDGIRFRENSGEVARFKDGNFGIGTTSPLSKLHAEGVVTIGGSTDGTSGSLAIQDNYSGVNHLANIGWNQSSGGPYFSYGLKQDGSSDWKSTFANFSGKRTYAKLDEDSFSMGFAPSQNTAVGSVVTNVSEKIRFNLESGNVGVGTSSPINGGGNAKWITIDGISGSSYSGGIVYSIGSSAKAYHYVQNNYLLHQGQSGVGHKFITNGTAERMRINSDGSIQQGNSGAAGQYAAAFGQNNTANSLEAFATGENTTASGRQAFAGGYNTTASGPGSFAIGGNSIASGANSLCAGGDGTTTGSTATSIGTLNDATGDYSFAAGYNSTASGLVSFAMGSGVTASGPKSTAFGQANNIAGELNFATGLLNTTNLNTYGNLISGNTNATNGYSSVYQSSFNIVGGIQNSLGNSSYSTSAGIASLVVGSNNKVGYWNAGGSLLKANPAQGNIIAGDNNYVLGNNSIVVGQYNTMNQGQSQAIFGVGCVNPGGTTLGQVPNQATPQFICGRNNVKSVSSGSGMHLFAVGNGGSDSTRYTSLNVYASLTGTARVGIAKDVPAYPLDVTGTGRFTGGTTTSDERLKENIQDNTLGLSELVQLRTVTFDWKTDEDLLGRTMEDHPQNKNCKGLIAQEVEVISSDLVETDDSEYRIKSINQGALTTMLIKAIQEQQDIIESLKERIETLENN